MNQEFTEELENKESEEFKNLEAAVLDTVNPGYEQIAKENDMTVDVELERFMARGHYLMTMATGKFQNTNTIFIPGD